MNLYIKVEDNQPINHPVLESNLLQTFVDGIIPPEYEKFERIPFNEELKKNQLQKAKCVYVKNENGIWQDSWTVEDLVGEEREKQIKMLTEGANEALRIQKAYAEQLINHCIQISDLDGYSIWNQYLNLLNNWEIKSVAPTTPAIPYLPTKDFEGNWILYPYGK